MLWYILGCFFIGLGIFLTLTTMLGFARFDNIYTRIHLSTINDMLGIPFAILGTSFLFLSLHDNANGIKLMFAIVIWYIVAPISSYIIIKIVYFYNNEQITNLE